VGAEKFGNWDGARNRATYSTSEGSFSNKFEADANYGISLLPGVKVNDTTLAYLRLGWNWANLKDSWNARIAATGVTSSGSKSNTSNGFQYGIGMETLLVANWSVRGEVNHTSFGSFTDGPIRVKPSDTQALVGVTYHFA
jgi:opacity protein-like surface antigen